MAKHEEKPDGLEIIAIGKLYNGLWDKKYWSSSRGKDRYPYPVGYKAVRTQNGITYTMEILEGLKGPVFTISSTDGQSCSGQTPDIVWERFKKKGCVLIKLWHGKRFSCKIDGVELFGFKNPFVQRLLRELVSNVSVTMERSLLSSSSINRASSGTHHQDHIQCTNCCKAPCSCSCLQPDMGIPQVTRKRSTKNNVVCLKSKKEVKLKRIRLGHEAQNVDVSNSGQSCLSNYHNGFPSTTSSSKDKKADLETAVEDGNNLVLGQDDFYFDSTNSFKHVKQVKHLAALEENSHFNSESSKAKEESITLVEDQKPLKSKFINIQGFSFSKQVEEAGETFVPKDSETINDMDLFAPDTLELPLDGTYNSAMDIPNESPSNIKDDLDAAQMGIAEDSIAESHAEEIVMSTANDNSEKCDADSIGQEIAKSMMTVLLPRALPLLKTFSRKNKITTKSAKFSCHGTRSQEGKEGTNLSADVASLEDLNVERQKDKADTLGTDFGSFLPSCEESASVAPDSFENDQCENTESTQLPLFQDVSAADKSAFGRYTCIAKSIGLAGNGNPQQGQAADSITSFCPEAHLVLEKGLQKEDDLVAGFTSGFTPPNRRDMYIDSNDTSLHQETHSEQKDVKTFARPTEGTVHTTAANSTGIVCFDYVLERELSAGTGGPGTGNMPVTSFPDIANSTRHLKAPHSESSLNFRDVFAPETYSATKGLPTLDDDQVKLSHSPVEEDSINDETRHDVPHEDKSYIIPEGAFCNIPTVTSHQETARASNYNDFADAFNTSISCEGKPQAPGNIELFGFQGNNELNFSTLRLPEQGAIFHSKTENDSIDCSNMNTSTNVKHINELEDVLELVGCYVHPLPISMVLLRTKGNDMYVCVLCGYLMEKDKSLFIYKVPVKGKRRGCPSVIGHASIVSPISDAFGIEIAVDSSSLQFTPDGQCLVLLNSIKAPSCRVGNVYCPCSVCTTGCFERNAVKIVEVKLGYVSTVSKLKTTDSVCCILVCEPSYLLAAEESGRLHLWTMNSTWTDSTKESYLPTSDCTPSCIVEMKRIPKRAALVVGHNAFGEFCLWDITKQILVSKFSASRISVFRFLPVSLCRLPSTDFLTAGIASEEYIKSIMDETKMWTSSKGGVNHAFSPMKDEDVAVCLLVSTVPNTDVQHGYRSNDSGVKPVGCWSLALLAKSTVILGDTLDPRAAVIGASAGYGIMATCDELVYMWELSKGTELGELLYCKGTKVTCIAADDSDSGAFAIACDGGQLRVYLHSPRAFAR